MLAVFSFSNNCVFLLDNDDVVIGYEWVSTLDSRTSDICKRLDGEVFLNKDKGYKPRLPQHPNERSSTAPALDKRYTLDDDDSTRASAMAGGGKQVDGKETYYSLLKKQPRDYVLETLGKTRGKLFLDGGMTIKEFKNLTTDQKFRPLNLQQMKEKDPQSFADAGV